MAIIRLSNFADREAAKRLIDLAPQHAHVSIRPATSAELAIMTLARLQACPPG